MKKNIISYIICLCAFVLLSGKCFAISAQSKTSEDYSVEKDLLHQLRSINTGDVSRLEIYDKICKDIVDTDTKRYYIDKLLKEAEAQSNNEYICKAYLHYMVLAYNDLDVSSVNKWYDLFEPIARKEKLYDLLFRGRRCVIDMMNITGDYEREEKSALEMLEEARLLDNKIGLMVGYQSLSYAYTSTYRLQEAANVLEKGYKIAIDEQNEDFILELNNMLINVYKVLNDSPNTIKRIKSLDAYLQKRLEEDPLLKENLRGWVMLTYTAYLSYYTYEEEYDTAAKYLKMAEDYRMKGYLTYENNYLQACYSYYKEVGQNKEAVEVLDTLIGLYGTLSASATSYMNMKKADLLEDMGKEDEAISIYQYSLKVMDSMQVVYINKQIDELKKGYKADLMLLKKKEIERNFQILFLALLIILFLALVLFNIHTRRTKKKLQASENEMRRLAKEMEQANKVKEIFLSSISTAIKEPLNVVVDGSLKLVSEENMNEEDRALISQTINSTSVELMELINSVLDLSRLEAGMMKFKPEEIEIIAFIKEVREFLVGKDKKVELILPETDEEFKVKHDSNRLREVFNKALMGEAGSTIKLIKEPNATFLKIYITSTPLANVEPTEKITIANEVNRLLIEAFEGNYFVRPKEDSTAVCFTLPIILN